MNKIPVVVAGLKTQKEEEELSLIRRERQSLHTNNDLERRKGHEGGMGRIVIAPRLSIHQRKMQQGGKSCSNVRNNKTLKKSKKSGADLATKPERVNILVGKM